MSNNNNRNRFTSMNSHQRGRGRGRGRGSSRGGRGNYNRTNNNQNTMNNGNYNRDNRDNRGGGRGGYNRDNRGGGRGGYNRDNNRYNNNNNTRGRPFRDGGNRGGRGGGGYDRNNTRNQGCFKCGEIGHFSRECPNNRGGGRGGRGGGRGRGRGRGGYNRGNYGHGNRGGFRGNNQRNNREFRGKDPSQRFKDQASESLMTQIKELNRIDPYGPQEVKCVEYSNGWRQVQSLSTGNPYYYNPSQNIKPQLYEPCELKDAQIEKEHYQQQGSSFVKPPKLNTYPKQLNKIPIITNAFQLYGNFIQNEIHIYNVIFTPEISSQNKSERRKALIGIAKQEKYTNRGLLNAKFGYWYFDNNNLYTMGKPSYKSSQNDELKLSDKYSISFRWIASSFPDGIDLELSSQEQILNVFNKRSMENGNFNEIRRSWFYKTITNPPNQLRHCSPTKMNEDVQILHGFNCRINLNNCNLNVNDDGTLPEFNNNKIERVAVFRVDLANKQISGKTVHDIISDFCVSTSNIFPGSLEHKELIKKRLDKHFFMMDYNSYGTGNSRKIMEIDFNEDENSTFLQRNGTEISYKNYLKKTYGINNIKKEICILKNDRGNGFLPQFAFLTLRSDEIDPANKYTNPGVEQELLRAQALVNHLNYSQEQDAKKRSEKNSKKNDDSKQKEKHWRDSMKYQIKINDKPIEAQAIVLNYPRISIMAFNNQIKTTSLHPREFKWGGRDGTKGFFDNIKRISKWIIISSNKRAMDEVIDKYGAYIGMRGFRQDPPLLPPQNLMLDFKNMKSVYSELDNIIKNKFQVIFLIIPDDKSGSEIKVRITKYVSSYKTAKNNGLLLQCIQEQTCFGRAGKDSILGAIEQMMGKYGNILYQIIPNIHNKSPYYNKTLWTIGIDVSHPSVGMRGHNPSTCIVSLQSLPFMGTQRGIINKVWFNSDRKDIIPYQAMYTMVYNILNDMINKLKNPKERPDYIIIFRDGLPDNALKEVHSKEYVGIVRGIKMIAQILKKKWKIIWKPKLQYIIVSKDPIDKFGVIQGQRIQPLRDPCVVVNGITNIGLFDVFLWNYHPSNDVLKIKPKRFVILKDSIGLCKGKQNNVMSLMNIIYALSFTYHPSLPFIQGGTSQPSPITWAKHYAEKFASLVLSEDKGIKDLVMAKNLKMMPQICWKIMKPIKIDVPIIKSQKSTPKSQKSTTQSQKSTTKSQKSTAVNSQRAMPVKSQRAMPLKNINNSINCDSKLASISPKNNNKQNNKQNKQKNNKQNKQNNNKQNKQNKQNNQSKKNVKNNQELNKGTNKNNNNSNSKQQKKRKRRRGKNNGPNNA